jgi:hypothetical protein
VKGRSHRHNVYTNRKNRKVNPVNTPLPGRINPDGNANFGDTYGSFEKRFGKIVPERLQINLRTAGIDPNWQQISIGKRKASVH